MLNQFDLYNHLVQYAVDTNGNVLCFYGDPAYTHRPQLQRPFHGPRINKDEKDWNTAMSKVRVSVERVFGDIIYYFKFVDLKKNLKGQLSAGGKMYIVCALLQMHDAVYMVQQRLNMLIYSLHLLWIISFELN